jgi:hypothetical protein
MWRKIWIRDIKGILMMSKIKWYYPEKWSKEEIPRIEPLTSRFLHRDLDLDFFARKLPN